ncbi:hypothetical protein [Sinorhizobium fredii]|uniref:Transmembrane protein n=1 Tax=Rhizobium fredii TaxID=380 RepID=A0A2L0HCU9_RHIFR|nr:hypothetical protein [Sinorhizobium fredii]AUX79295.1 hypothetical protein NXT3_PC00116 [Sinorhizobium fredii]
MPSFEARVCSCAPLGVGGMNGLESLLSFTPVLQPQTLSYVRTFLRLVHFAGLVIGFGGAVFLDLLVARYRRMTMTVELVGNIEWVSRFVALGLLLLWISGAGLLLLYQVSEPEKLMNPKIWAKVTIVAILSINGLAIHRLVLPFLKRRIGTHLLAGLKPRTKVALIWCGVVSAVSWSVPVVLGAAPQLNFAVPCAVILAAYGLALAQAFLIALFVLRDRDKVAMASGPR